MKSGPSLSFLALCLALVVAFSALWLWLSDAYGGVLAGLVGLLSPSSLDVKASGVTLAFDWRPPSGEVTRLPASLQTWGFGFGFVVTGALVLATPGSRFLSRTRRLLVVWAVLFAAQVLVTGLYLWMVYLVLTGKGSIFLLKGSLWLVYAVWVVLPPSLWVAWALRSWARRPIG